MFWYVGRFLRYLKLITWTDTPDVFEEARAHGGHFFAADTIRFAKSRIRICTQSHLTCNSSAPLPLWVIEISDDGLAARLVPGSRRVARYVTLSYKWGNATRYTMTTANRSFLQHGIPLDQLPKTFSDAIELTHKLSYKYLWIDALCITQNDSREVSEQIAAMEDVYSGSDLTIFAAGGDDANWGFHRTRDATFVYPIQVTVGAKLPWLSKSVYKTLWITNALERRENGIQPLYKRGWVLQEQLLSRRELVFHREYISWRCLCDNVSEVLPFNRKVHIPGYVRDGDGLAEIRNWFWAKSTDVLHKADIALELYYRAIELYMGRTLTFGSDVLPAITGLLAMTKQRTGSEFYYGTCLQDTRGFLWVRSEFRKDRPNGSEIPPSWAWTSCFGSSGYFMYVKSVGYTWQVGEHHSTRDRGELETISWTQWGTFQTNRKRYPSLSFTPKRGGHYEDYRIRLDAYEDLDENDVTVARRLLCIFVASTPGPRLYVTYGTLSRRSGYIQADWSSRIPTT